MDNSSNTRQTACAIPEISDEELRSRADNIKPVVRQGAGFISLKNRIFAVMHLHGVRNLQARHRKCER